MAKTPGPLSDVYRCIRSDIDSVLLEAETELRIVFVLFGNECCCGRSNSHMQPYVTRLIKLPRWLATAALSMQFADTTRHRQKTEGTSLNSTLRCLRSQTNGVIPTKICANKSERLNPLKRSLLAKQSYLASQLINVEMVVSGTTP